MTFDKVTAEKILREASKDNSDTLNSAWEDNIETLSRLCSEGKSKTHIAFMGTAILAKSLCRTVDLYAIKPTYASSNNHNAYSARTLCHNVLVPLAAELGFNLGVNGREPLNNQPYFRMQWLGDDTPVHGRGRAAFDYMIKLIGELSALKTETQARAALRSFVEVRKRYQPHYIINEKQFSIRPDNLTEIITAFVRDASEGGRRAQAIVAGLFDVFAGTGRVESGRINDPSRHYPGDIAIRKAEDSEKWEKAIEVRDKSVSVADVQIFAQRCINAGVQEAAVVMVGQDQTHLDCRELSKWASRFGIGLTLFHGWPNLVDQILFWSEIP